MLTLSARGAECLLIRCLCFYLVHWALHFYGYKISNVVCDQVQLKALANLQRQTRWLYSPLSSTAVTSLGSRAAHAVSSIKSRIFISYSSSEAVQTEANRFLIRARTSTPGSSASVCCTRGLTSSAAAVITCRPIWPFGNHKGG
jgi:hypothetical protein